MVGGEADCKSCKHAEKHKYSSSLAKHELTSINCKARSQKMTQFKDFYCHFFEKD